MCSPKRVGLYGGGLSRVYICAVRGFELKRSILNMLKCRRITGMRDGWKTKLHGSFLKFLFLFSLCKTHDHKYVGQETIKETNRETGAHVVEFHAYAEKRVEKRLS